MERSPEKDSESFLTTCEMIRSSMDNIAKLKANSDDGVSADLRDLNSNFSLFIKSLFTILGKGRYPRTSGTYFAGFYRIEKVE